MTLGEIADLLIRDYGVYNASNLDCGRVNHAGDANPLTGIGSIINVSSNNPNGRLEGSNLAIFATAVPEPSTWLLICFGVGRGARSQQAISGALVKRLVRVRRLPHLALVENQWMTFAHATAARARQRRIL